MATEQFAVDKMKGHFGGCKCLGVIEAGPYGSVQLYDVGSKNVVGAWSADGSKQLWPYSWVQGKRISRVSGRTFSDRALGKVRRVPFGNSKKRVPLKDSTGRKRVQLKAGDASSGSKPKRVKLKGSKLPIRKRRQ